MLHSESLVPARFLLRTLVGEPGGASQEIALFGKAGGPAGRGAVQFARGLAIPRHLEQMGPHREEAVVPGQSPVGVQGVELLEAGRRTVDHRRGDGAIERHHRIVGHALEQAIQRQNLRPVGVLGSRRFVVNGRDRGLQLIRANRTPGEGVGDERDAFRDGLPVPQGAILLRERDQIAVRPGPRRPPGIGQQHQRQQSRDLPVVRKEVVNSPGQPNRLIREIAALEVGADAAGIALVEDQIEHVQDGAESFGPLPVGGHAKWHAGRLDALLGPADPLRHGRLGHEERVGNLGRREAADGPQRERNRRRTSERSVTAHEQQDERVVLFGLILEAGGGSHPLVGRHLHHDDGFAAPPGELDAQVIGHAPGGDLDQPSARVVGHTLLWPLHGRREQGFLDRVFGPSEVPESSDDRAEHLRRELAQQMLGIGVQRRHRSSGGPPITCRTSIGMFIGTPPFPGAADARAAIS